MSDLVTEEMLERLHRQASQATLHFVYTMKAMMSTRRKRDPRRVMADLMEQRVRTLLEGRGLFVTGTRHKESFDLLAQGVRIEVKAATWDGRRYQCNLHDNKADVLVWGCLDGTVHWFVIPFGEVRGLPPSRGLRVLNITSHDPRDYVGKWMPFYERWETIDELVAAGRNAWQPALIPPV